MPKINIWEESFWRCGGTSSCASVSCFNVVRWRKNRVSCVAAGRLLKLWGVPVRLAVVGQPSRRMGRRASPRTRISSGVELGCALGNQAVHRSGRGVCRPEHECVVVHGRAGQCYARRQDQTIPLTQLTVGAKNFSLGSQNRLAGDGARQTVANRVVNNDAGSRSIDSGKFENRRHR